MSPLRAVSLLPFVGFTIAAACGTTVTGGGGGSSSGATGAGQCVPPSGSCDPQFDLGPDGGETLVKPTCCEGQCAISPCCYSDCSLFCVPEGSCCNSGAQCDEDSQCCSGTCEHPDPANGPGEGTCM